MQYIYFLNCTALHKTLLFIFLLLAAASMYAQPNINFREIQQIDSIAGTTGAASHFAALYAKTMDSIEKQLAGMDTATVRQIRKLELNFAGYFIKACNMYNEEGKADTAWAAYFSDTGFSPLRLKLLGINAHINGDLWKALCDSHTAMEIKQTGPVVFLFHQSLVKIYNDLYNGAKAENKKIKTLHVLSFGLAKNYGRHLLKKWRKRQIQIATCYYFNQSKFERLKSKTERKKNRIDKMINRRL